MRRIHVYIYITRCLCTTAVSLRYVRVLCAVVSFPDRPSLLSRWCHCCYGTAVRCIPSFRPSQIDSLSEALDEHFDYDRYVRSRGHDRHRDEHTDVTSLITCVEGKTPSQVGWVTFCGLR